MADPSWIEDGHRLHFRIDRGDIVIAYVECPYEGKTALCNRNREQCVIDTFVTVYGAEVNVGSAYINGPVEIAWTPELGECDFDREFCQVWVVPTEDVDYRAYKMLSGGKNETS